MKQKNKGGKVKERTPFTENLRPTRRTVQKWMRKQLKLSREKAKDRSKMPRQVVDPSQRCREWRRFTLLMDEFHILFSLKSLPPKESEPKLLTSAKIWARTGLAVSGT